MGKILGTSWKTSLAGLLTAGLTAALSVLQTGNLSPEAIGVSVGLAVLGRLAKDAGVTGDGK